MKKQLLLYSREKETPDIIPLPSLEDPRLDAEVGERLAQKLREDMDLLEGTLGPFDREEFLRGDLSPLTFGSAKYSWGVDLFLDLFAANSPSPPARMTNKGPIEATNKQFSGFVFKIQANMDKNHRDRVAFLRICSGRFERGMKVHHVRLQRELRLAYANQFLARERETVEEAFAGDIVGIIDTGYFRIGDTITDGKDFTFDPIPRFSPEIFGRLSIKDPLKRKTLQKGLQQLSEEGTVQLLYEPHLGQQDPIIGAIGELQFDVLIFRLNEEYGLDVRLEKLPFSVARWPRLKTGEPISGALNGGAKLYLDETQQPVVLLEREWDLRWLEKENPEVNFLFSAPIHGMA